MVEERTKKRSQRQVFFPLSFETDQSYTSPVADMPSFALSFRIC